MSMKMEVDMDLQTTSEKIRAASHQLYQELDCIYQNRGLRIAKLAIQFSSIRSSWGKYDPLTKTIHLSDSLVAKPWYQLMGVFLHELAHHLVASENLALNEPPHGPAFHQACARLGVPNHFRKSAIDLQDCVLDWREDTAAKSASSQSEKILKLFALGDSSNQHESQLAIAKAKELSKKYFLEPRMGNLDYQSIVYNFNKKRISVFESHCISILNEHFFVQTILIKQFNVAKNSLDTAVELIGRPTHVLIAENALNFILQSAERAWQELKATQGNTDLRKRNSFLAGFVDGFAKQLQNEGRLAPEPPDLLPVLAKEDLELKKYLKQLHPRIRNRTSGYSRVDRDFFDSGSESGKKLKLRKSLVSPNKSSSGQVKRLADSQRGMSRP